MKEEVLYRPDDRNQLYYYVNPYTDDEKMIQFTLRNQEEHDLLDVEIFVNNRKPFYVGTIKPGEIFESFPVPYGPYRKKNDYTICWENPDGSHWEVFATFDKIHR